MKSFQELCAWFDENTTDVGIVLGVIALMAAVAFVRLAWEFFNDDWENFR